MSYKDLDYLIYDYPLSLLHTSEDVEEGVKEKNYFYYETPIINSDSRLYSMKAIKYYLKEYLSKTERLMDEYIKANHPVVMPDIYLIILLMLLTLCIFVEYIFKGFVKVLKKNLKKYLVFKTVMAPTQLIF